MEYKICNDKNCEYKGEPQPIDNFCKRKLSKDGLNTICKTCVARYSKEREIYRKKVRNLTKYDKLTVIACLYVTRKENINRLSKLFNETKETIIKVLKYENLYEYVECVKCGKLKHYSEFSRDANRGIGHLCSKCHFNKYYNNEETRKYARERNRHPVSYQVYAPKLEKYDIIRESEGGLLETKCSYCGEWFMPKGVSVGSRVRAINEKYGNAEYRMYCSDQCKNVCPIYNKKPEELIKQDMIRSGRLKPQELNREVQPELRQMVFARDNYTCQKCGKHRDELNCGIHAHHMEGVRWNPLESADLDTCITYCEDCHKLVHKIPGCQYHEMRCNAEDMIIQ